MLIWKCTIRTIYKMLMINLLVQQLIYTCTCTYIYFSVLKFDKLHLFWSQKFLFKMSQMGRRVQTPISTTSANPWKNHLQLFLVWILVLTHLQIYFYHYFLIYQFQKLFIYSPKTKDLVTLLETPNSSQFFALMLF